MKRKALTVGLIVLLLEISVFPMTSQVINKPSVPLSDGNWLYVGGSGPGNYTEIQDAIDNSSDGDTIFVFSGTYIGYVIINKAITLIGEDKNTTIISGYFAYTISIVTDGVNLSGFTIQNGGRQGEGVRIDSSYNNVINNIIDIPDDRIRLFGHSNNFAGNTIKNTYLYISGDCNIVSGNTIANEYYGIYLVDCWDNIISNNSLFTSGLFISFDNICNNIVTNNTVNGKPLVYLYNESNLVFDGDAGQIILVNCTNITIQNQEIINTTVGIQIVGSNSCVISSNTILDNHYGTVLNGWNNTIYNNKIANNYYGIGLSGDRNIISRNTISNNYGGIYFDYSTNYNTIIDNIITHNQNSILLDYGSDFNTLINNTITNNDNAFWISSDCNTISRNMIATNKENGIYFVYSNNNKISDNIITNNNGIGIILDTSDYNNIINNTITNNSDKGIGLSGDNNTISANSIINHIDDGIYLFGNNNTIFANTITNNNNGINVYQHEFNIIADNTITQNNWSGIYLNSSSNNNISGNSLSNNRQGIYLVLSMNNTMVKNNFLRNKRHALFENCTNWWNHNYWGRPRLLPKLIFGKKMIQNEWEVPLFDVDWRPALKPYHSLSI